MNYKPELILNGFNADHLKAMTKILIVDDEEIARLTLADMLEEEGYTCSAVENASEARGLLQNQNFNLILSDINMPGESGLEFIKFVSSSYPNTAVIMVTALDDPNTATIALKSGCFDYITKPITLNRLLISVTNALHRRKLEISNQAYRDNLEEMIVERTAMLREALDGIIQTVALTVETRDPYTAGHQKNVAIIACAIAVELGLPDERIEGIKMAGIIHDLGKISVPAEVLSRPGHLTQNEFNLIKDHPQAGYAILKDVQFPWPVAEIVLQHHEKIDGSGYPQGLTGDKILLEAKIITVADVLEAIAAHRPYRPALGLERAMEEIKRNRGKSFDPEVVDACLKIIEDKNPALAFIPSFSI